MEKVSFQNIFEIVYTEPDEEEEKKNTIFWLIVKHIRSTVM